MLLLATLRALRGAASEVREIRVEPPPLMDEPDDPALYSQADLVGQEQPT